MVTIYETEDGKHLSKKQFLAREKRKVMSQSRIEMLFEEMEESTGVTRHTKKSLVPKAIHKQLLESKKQGALTIDNRIALMEYAMYMQAGGSKKRTLEVSWDKLSKWEQIKYPMWLRLPKDQKQAFETSVKAFLYKTRSDKKMTNIEIAHLFCMSKAHFEQELRTMSGKSIKNLRKQTVSRQEATIIVDKEVAPALISGWISVDGDPSWETRIKYADPIISTEQKDYKARMYPPRADAGDSGKKPATCYSKAMGIIDERRFLQPIKRIRIAAHSFTQADVWTTYDRTRKKMPVVGYKTEIARTIEDKYLTLEGGIIVSSTWAKAQNKGVGDKILGLNGLKGIICETRKMNPTLIINKNQIWGKKLSRMCGGGVLELSRNGTLNIFTEAAHNIAFLPFRDTEASFSPELVPFLAHYLPTEELKSILGRNVTRFSDFMHMINFEFKENSGNLVLMPKLEQPKCDRKGGKCYKWGYSLWARKEPESYLADTPNSAGYYPFVLEELWRPDWLSLMYIDKKGEERENIEVESFFQLSNEELKANYKEKYPSKTFSKKKLSPWIYGNIVKQMHRLVFAKIPNSIGELRAYQKDGDPREVIISKVTAEIKGWNEGDGVLVYRNPVVSKQNIQKMYIKFADIPEDTTEHIMENTIGINIEALRLMFGDTDGDGLRLIRTDVCDAFKVSDEDLAAERAKIMSEIKELDAIVIPTSKLDIQAQMRIAWIKSISPSKSKVLGSTINTSIEKRLKSFKKALPELEKTDTVRTDANLREEAKREHYKLNQDQDRTTHVGNLTKKAWIANDSADMIAAIAAIEQMKDRPKEGSGDAFGDAVAKLQGYVDTLEVSKDNKAMAFPYTLGVFFRF